MTDWENTSTSALIEEVEQLRYGISRDLDKLASAIGAINDPAVLVETMADLRDFKQVASNIYYECEQAYTADAPKKQEVPNLGLVEVKTSTTRKGWEHDELFRSVVARLADEPGIFYDEDGVRLPPAAMAANVVARLRDVLSPSWKVTGIRALGLDETEFCKVEEAHKSVVLPPRAA